MRWEIQGAAVDSAQRLTLFLEADDKPAAVQMAHAHRVVVSDVAPARRRRGRGKTAALVAAVVLAAGLGVSTGLLYQRNVQINAALAASATAEQNIAGRLTTAQDQIEASRVQIAALQGTASDREQRLNGVVTSLRAELANVNRELTQSRGEALDALADATALKTSVKEAQAQLAAAREAAQKSQADAAEREKNWQAMAGALQAQIDAARKDRSTLSALNDDLQRQVLAYKSKVDAQAPAATEPATPVAAEPAKPADQIALAVTFDDAMNFMHLNFPQAHAARTDGTFSTYVAALEDHADILTVQTDAGKSQVYSVALDVCLAADAPKEVVADNQAMIGKFVGAFAPNWTGGAGWLKDAVAGLGGKEGAGTSIVQNHCRWSVRAAEQGMVRIDVRPVQEKLAAR